MTWSAPRTRTLLFDLDGTLVRLDGPRRLELSMLARGARRFASVISPLRFAGAFWHAARRAQQHDTDRVNHDVLCAGLAEAAGVDAARVVQLLEDLTTHDFVHMAEHFQPIAGARELLQEARARGHRVVLATNPVWPERAVKMRLAWGGLGDFVFDFISHSQVMTRAKPSLGYYRELCARLAVDPRDCVMIGDNPRKDLPAVELGIRTFLVGGRPPKDPRLDGFGSLADLGAWLRQPERIAS